MSQQGLTHGSTAQGLKHTEMFKMAVSVETLAGAKDIDIAEPPVHFLDPGGSGRNINLPDVTASDLADGGIMFMIVNTADAAEALTVRDGANGDATRGTVNQNGIGFFFWDGNAGQWRGQGVAA